MTAAIRSFAAFLYHLRFFHALVGWRFYVLVVLTIAMSWSEGVAIALLLPLLSGGGGNGTAIGAMVGRVLSFLHVPGTTEGVLTALVLFAFVKAGLSFGTVAWQYHISSKLTQDLRRTLLNKLLKVDYRWILGQNLSRLSVVIAGESATVSSGFLAFSKLFPHGITAATFVGIVAWEDVRLAAVIIAFGAGLFWAQTIPRRLTRRFAAKNNDEAIGMGSLMLQLLFSYKYLAATASLDRLHPRLLLAIRRITVLGYKLGITAAFSGAFPQPLVALVLAGILLWLNQTAGAGGVSAGIVVLIYLYRAMNEISAMQGQWQAFSASIPSIAAVRTLDADFVTNREQSGIEAPGPLQQSIRFENVHFQYDDKEVLSGVDLEIPKNSLVALVGASGAGKTTIADLLTGLLKPSTGSIRIDGRDLQDLDIREWRSRIGYVPQDPPMFTATVAENICFYSCDPAEPSCRKRIIEAGTRALCPEFVDGLSAGWDEPVGERGNRLSGGQRQRIAIARELFKDPEILILDEATSALDAESEHLFRQTLESLRGSITGVVIAHRLSTVKACDRVFVLHAGQMVEQGSVVELLNREGSRFRELARLQSF